MLVTGTTPFNHLVVSVTSQQTPNTIRKPEVWEKKASKLKRKKKNKPVYINPICFFLS